MRTVGSLCTGTAALEMAVEAVLGPLGHTFHAEADPDASRVLAQHYPGVANLGDITVADWSRVEPVDILTAGFPCQSFSVAGKRRGSNDERFLWPDVARAVGVLMPSVVLVENVPGLLTIEAGGVFAMVLADLHRLGYHVAWTTVGACKVGACHHRHRVYLLATLLPRPAPTGTPIAQHSLGGWVGYETTLFGDHVPFRDWPAAGVMADGQVWARPADPCATTGVLLPTPTAHLGGDRGSPSVATAARRIHDEGRRNLEDAIALLPTPRTSDGQGAGRHGDGGLDLRTAVALFPTPTARDAERGAGRTFAEGRPLSEVVALLPTHPTASSYGSNQSPSDGAAVRPSLERLVQMLPTPLATDYDGGPGRTNNRGEPKLSGAVALMPTPRASDAEKGGPNQRGSSGDLALPSAVQPGRFGTYEGAVRRHEYAFGIPAPEPTEPGRTGRPRMAAAFPEWMMCLPPGWITKPLGTSVAPMSKTHIRKAAIRIAGNGVVWPAAAYAFQLLGLDAALSEVAA